jgi:hypothetical protein
MTAPITEPAPGRLAPILNGTVATPDTSAPPTGFEPVLAELRALVVAVQASLDRATGPERLTVGREELAEMLGIAPPTLDRWLSAGLIGPTGTKLAGRKLFALSEIREWVEKGMPSRKTWAAMQGRGRK